MALRVESKSTQKLAPHLSAYIAGRYACARDIFIGKARDTYNRTERAGLARAARSFHYSYLAHVRVLP